jgi:hypothetical protein
MSILRLSQVFLPSSNKEVSVVSAVAQVTSNAPEVSRVYGADTDVSTPAHSTNQQSDAGAIGR